MKVERRTFMRVLGALFTGGVATAAMAKAPSVPALPTGFATGGPVSSPEGGFFVPDYVLKDIARVPVPLDGNQRVRWMGQKDDYSIPQHINCRCALPYRDKTKEDCRAKFGDPQVFRRLFEKHNGITVLKREDLV